MIYERLLDYYTIQSYIYTGLYLYGYIPNTYYIVNFVFLVGTIIQIMLHNTERDANARLKVLVFITHIVPTLIVRKPETVQNKKAGIRLLLFSIVIYLFYTAILRQVNIFKIYRNQYNYLFKY